MRARSIIFKKKKLLLQNLALGIVASLLVFFGSVVGYFERMEAGGLDFLFWLRGEIQSSQIVLVQIDDAAFRNLGEKQPLSRSYLAGLIEVLAQSGAAVIGLEVELKVPTNPKEDGLLLKAIENTVQDGASRVVTIYTIESGKLMNTHQTYIPSTPFTPRLRTLAGFADTPVDQDGVIRRVPLVVRSEDGSFLPSFALAVLARYADYDPFRLREAINREPEVSIVLPEWDILKATLAPQPTLLTFRPHANWMINFIGARGAFQASPSDAIFNLSKQKEKFASDNPFRGKIVLIGATFKESRDFYQTPHGLMSGVEIHANIIHTLLSRSQIRPAHPLTTLFLSLLAACLIALLITFLRPPAKNFKIDVALIVQVRFSDAR